MIIKKIVLILVALVLSVPVAGFAKDRDDDKGPWGRPFQGLQAEIGLLQKEIGLLQKEITRQQKQIQNLQLKPAPNAIPGPQGPAGPAGPAGPQGPAGASFDPQKLYFVEIDNPTKYSVTCQPGDYILSCFAGCPLIMSPHRTVPVAVAPLQYLNAYYDDAKVATCEAECVCVTSTDTLITTGAGPLYIRALCYKGQ